MRIKELLAHPWFKSLDASTEEPKSPRDASERIVRPAVSGAVASAPAAARTVDAHRRVSNHPPAIPAPAPSSPLSAAASPTTSVTRPPAVDVRSSSFSPVPAGGSPPTPTGGSGVGRTTGGKKIAKTEDIR